MTKISQRHKSVFTGKSVRGLLMGSAATLAIGGFAAPAMAQDEVAEDESSIITVIARKQTETLQEVPVTVTAIGGADLEKYSVDQVADVVSRVPTLNVQVGGSGSGGQLSLRGVGSSNISAAFDSAVAFDFDGVQVSSMRLVQAGFFDTAQVDILKGPQSLFFGKSASAGVFSIRSANPTNSWEFGGKASYEFEEKGYTAFGYASGPISDALGIRFAAQYNDIEEYALAQPGSPVVNPERGQTNLNTRLTLQWDPFDNFNANLKVNYQRNTNDGAIGHSEIFCGANGVADDVVLLQGAIRIPAGNDCNVNDQRFFYADSSAAIGAQIPSQQKGFERFQTNPGVAFGVSDIWFGRLKWDLDITDSLTISSVTGYLDQDAQDSDQYSYVGVGPAFSPIPAPSPPFPAGSTLPVSAIAPALAAVNAPGSPQGFGTGFTDHQLQQFTQEIRLASDFDGIFNFMIGAFYESRQIEFNTSQQAVNISIIAPDPLTGNTSDWQKQHHTDTEALSFFGSVTLDLTDQLQLSGGLRWTDEQKVNTIRVPYLHGLLVGPGFVAPGFFSGPINFSDSNFSPEATIRYQASDDINIFASFKTGFKSGGIDNSALPSFGLLGLGNENVNPADPDGRTFNQIVLDQIIFDSETGLGGEIGIKSQWADRTFTLNASAFYYVFDDLQVQNFDAQAIQFLTSNASQLTTQGLDVFWAWNTPVEGLSFSGNVAYTDAEFTADFFPSDDPTTVGVVEGDNINGRSAARAPKFAGNVAADWFVPLGDSLELGLGANVQFSGSYFTNEDSLTDVRQDSYVAIDGQISVGDPDGKWKLSLIGVNLTDELWINTSGGRPFLDAVGDDQVLTINRGRQVYVEASFKF